MNKKLSKRYLRLFSILVVLLIFVFLGRTVLVNFDEIKNFSFSFNYFYLFLAFVFAFLNILSLCLIWRYTFHQVSQGQRAGIFQSFIIFIKSWFGKYLPGRVWSSLGKIYFGSRDHLAVKPLGLAAVFEFVLSTISQVLAAVFFLFLLFRQALPLIYYIPLLGAVAGAGIFFLHPRILAWFINYFLKAFKKKPIAKQDFLSCPSIFRIILFYLLPPLLVGLSFAFLIKSFIVIESWQFVWLIGAFTVANPIAKLTLIAPAGLGIREGSVAFMLNFALTSALASLAALASRLWFISTDIIIFAFAFVIEKVISRKKKSITNNY